MTFDVRYLFYVEDADLEEMVCYCEEDGYTPQEAFDKVASGWDDIDYYMSMGAEEQIVEEIERRLNK